MDGVLKRPNYFKAADTNNHPKLKKPILYKKNRLKILYFKNFTKLSK
ncbi:hypothetical protein ACVWYG_001731 [Pedobacter sp. UYEF25]